MTLEDVGYVVRLTLESGLASKRRLPVVALAESESENLNSSPPIQLEVAESSSRLNHDVHRRFTINELSKQAICITTQSQHLFKTGRFHYPHTTAISQNSLVSISATLAI